MILCKDCNQERHEDDFYRKRSGVLVDCRCKKCHIAYTTKNAKERDIDRLPLIARLKVIKEREKNDKEIPYMDQ